MEAWRQWLLGGRRKRAYQKQTKITLTPTGLLMEGDYTPLIYGGSLGQVLVG
jgi:hypothetical protein